MNLLVLSLIIATTTFEYLGSIGALPHIGKYAAEILSAVTALMVVIYGSRNRFQFVRPAYWFAFAAAAAIIVCGVLANSVVVGPMFAGMRVYLRAVPLFFLPAVYAFSDRQIRSQLFLLLILGLAQVPISIVQRLKSAPISASGDDTVGTLGGSGLLSIFLICAICVLTAGFLRKHIKLSLFLPLFLLLLLPTTINETKATAFLLPIGLLVTFIAGSAPGLRFRNAMVAASLLIVAASVFIPVYDFYASRQKHVPPISEFFTDKATFERYVNKDAQLGSTARVVGRVDAIVVPLSEMARDTTHLAFGLGIGNASESSIGSNFTGRYFQSYGAFLRTAASLFILEVGLMGLALVLTIDYLIYRDSRAVAEAENGMIGTLAVGWAGVAAVIVLATFYANLVRCEGISYLFWYFSGVVAAHRCRLFQRAQTLNRGIAESSDTSAGGRGHMMQDCTRLKIKAKNS